MNHILFAIIYSVAASNEVEASANGFEQDEYSLTHKGFTYRVHCKRDKSTFEEAVKYCESVGMRLPVPRSSKANDLLFSFAVEQEKNILLGIADSPQTGYADIYTGKSLKFENWIPRGGVLSSVFSSIISPNSNIHHVITHYANALSKAFWADYSFAVLNYESGQWYRENGGTDKQFWTICVVEQNQMPNMFDWQVYENTEQPLFAATVVTSAIIMFVGMVNWIVIQVSDPRIY